MKAVMRLVAVVLSVVSVTTSMTVGTSVSKKVVAIGLERRYPVDLIDYERRRMRKRAGTVEETLVNEETLYFANLTLGTPAQSLKLHIDTGSSDLWVNTANSSFCSRRNACDGGTYDPNSSSTLKIVNDQFNISYVDGSGASGDYVSDTLVFAGVTLDDFQFGLGEVSTSSEGILGIGYTGNEVQVQRAGLNAYPNLPLALKNGGHISRNAYSLWLNDQESSTGTILFGGVNSAKYQGELATLPIIEVSGSYVDLMVALTGVSVGGTAITSSNLPVAALLDSGTTLTYLPSDITSTIFSTLEVDYNDQLGYGTVQCSLASQSGTVEYSFSGQTISVSYEELVIQTGSNARTCIFGIAPTDGISVFGDTFLRSAYVVYDLDNNQISLAQTVFNATDDNVQEIPSGTSLPPGATAVASAVSSVNGVSSGTSSSAHAAGTVIASGANESMQELPRTTLLAASIVFLTMLML